MERRTLLKGGAALGLTAALGPKMALAAGKPKIGFILVGPKNDNGWSQHHFEAVKKAEEKFGDAVEFVVQESVPEGADSERVMSQMALSGANLIFATSFGYMDAVQNVAAKFPKVMFEHATGYKTAANAATYNARFYEGRAVCGHIAGKMTKTNKIGYIGSFPIPEVTLPGASGVCPVRRSWARMLASSVGALSPEARLLVAKSVAHCLKLFSNDT